MSERTGLGLIEVALLDAAVATNAIPTRPHVKTHHILDQAASLGVGHVYGHAALSDLGHRWKVPLRLFDHHGNFGSYYDPPANPHVTEARLSRLGLMAWQSEQGDLPPLPIGLINGNRYSGGLQPALRPSGVFDALLALLDDDRVADAELLKGLSIYEWNDPMPLGDLDALFQGEATHLSYAPRFRIDEGKVLIDRLPIGVSIFDMAETLSRNADDELWSDYLIRCQLDDDEPEVRLPIVDVGLQDVDGSDSIGSIAVWPEGAVDPIELLLLIVTRMQFLWRPPEGDDFVDRAMFPAPVADLLREWIHENRTSDTEEALKQARSLA